MSWQDATGWLVAFGLLVLVAFSLFDRIEAGDKPRQTQRQVPQGEPVTRDRFEARVSRVVDGDTIIVRNLNRYSKPTGAQRRVRYIGIDTPESVKPDTAPECFGKEAAAANRRLVDGRVVTLVSDAEPYDDFGRALAYVYVGGKFVNGDLVAQGFARTLTIAPNTARAADLKRLQNEAKRTNKGLWRECDR